MANKKRRKLRLSKGEKLLYVGAFTVLLLTVVVQIFFSANVGNLKMDVEKQRYEIAGQMKKNESLEMKVSELTSFDKIKDIVKDMGLAYNRNNVVVVED